MSGAIFQPETEAKIDLLNLVPAIRASRRARTVQHGRGYLERVEAGCSSGRDEHGHVGIAAVQVWRDHEAQLPFRFLAQVPVLDDGPQRHGTSRVFETSG